MSWRQYGGWEISMNKILIGIGVVAVAGTLGLIGAAELGYVHGNWTILTVVSAPFGSQAIVTGIVAKFI